MELPTLLLITLEPCWLWWLILSAIAFILGALLGCLLCSNRKRLRELESENEGLKARVTNWEKDYSSLKYQHEELEKDLKTNKQKLNSCEADKAVLRTKLEKLQAQAEPPETGAANIAAGNSFSGPPMAFANIFPDDNLQIIEGIGPKIEGLLKSAGITNWGLLAAATAGQLRGLLNDAGPNMRIHKPDSWPQQAQLAADGKWEELIALQKTLGGDGQDTPAKVEKLGMGALGFSSNPEDLKIIEGIGPKIEQLLKAKGINTWQDLANSDTAQLEAILQEAGNSFRLSKPATWPQQASLAAAGKWQALKELQDRLQGGVDKDKV